MTESNYKLIPEKERKNYIHVFKEMHHAIFSSCNSCGSTGEDELEGEGGGGGEGEARTTSLAKLWCTPNRRHFASPTPPPPFLSKVFSTKEQLSIGKCIAYLYIKGDTSVSIEESPCLPYSAPLQLHVWRNYDPIQIGNIFTSPPPPCLFPRVVLTKK